MLYRQISFLSVEQHCQYRILNYVKHVDDVVLMMLRCDYWRNLILCCVECQSVFGLITKKPDDKEEKLLVFAVDDTSASKTEFLTSLSKTVCTSQCRTDYVNNLSVILIELIASDIINRSQSDKQ